jgi:hypothetical protein
LLNLCVNAHLRLNGNLRQYQFCGFVLHVLHLVVQVDYVFLYRGRVYERFLLWADEFFPGILLLLPLLLSLLLLLVLSLLIRRHLKASAYDVLIVVVDRFFVTHFCFLCIFTKCIY